MTTTPTPNPPARGRGRPRLGVKFTGVLPADAMHDAHALHKAGLGESVADLIRKWVTAGHQQWRNTGKL